jgi:hypothetical protein
MISNILMRRTSNINPILRIGLVLLFASCGIWLLPHSLGMLYVGQPSNPLPIAWTWSPPVEFVFYRIAAGVWLGIEASRSFGIPGLIFADSIASIYYLSAAIAVFVKKPLGTILGFAVSAGSAIIFLLEDLRMLTGVSLSGWKSILVGGIIPPAFYLILTCILGWSLLKARRERVTQPLT